MRTAIIGLALAASMAALCWSPPLEAGFRGARNHYQDGEVIVARSRFGNGTISGVVRPARVGWEVRLPRGTWIGCRRSCEETLRVNTVDLTDDTERPHTGYGSFQRECGIFGCLKWEFSY